MFPPAMMQELKAMGDNPEMLEGFMSMMQGGGLMSRYQDLDRIRETEENDTECFLECIQEACAQLELEKLEEGYIVDLGSGCGYIAAQYQHKFPKLTVIASDVTYPEPAEQQATHPSMALLRSTMQRFLEDHRANVVRETCETKRLSQEAYVKTYEKMVKHACEIDVLAPPAWENVRHIAGACKLVTSTMILHQKAFETPEMWKNIFLGAAHLLMPGGVLLLFDGNAKNQGKDFQDMSEKSAVSVFAEKCGLKMKLHEERERGVLFLIVLEKMEMAMEMDSMTKELAEGDLVEIQGLVGKKEHNGCSGILCAFHEEKGRWAVKVNAGVMAKRNVVAMLIKPDNLKQMMPCVGSISRKRGYGKE